MARGPPRTGPGAVNPAGTSVSARAVSASRTARCSWRASRHAAQSSRWAMRPSRSERLTSSRRSSAASISAGSHLSQFIVQPFRGWGARKAPQIVSSCSGSGLLCQLARAGRSAADEDADELERCETSPYRSAPSAPSRSPGTPSPRHRAGPKPFSDRLRASTTSGRGDLAV